MRSVPGSDYRDLSYRQWGMNALCWLLANDKRLNKIVQHFDLIIGGAGILGLAHAYHAARAGLRVAVFDRDSQADGASTRNFGMLAILAQAEGQQTNDAQRTLKTWQHIAPQAGVSLERRGCLLVARHKEELAVLREYTNNDHARSSSRWVNKTDLPQHASGLNVDNLIGGLWSENAWKIDQRQAVLKIAQWLQQVHNVTFFFSTSINQVESGLVTTSRGDYRTSTVIVCAGSEFSTLFPEEFAASGVTTCRLQMLRSQPQPENWKLNPFILSGLSLPRYAAFSHCPSLPDLDAMQQANYAQHRQYGIHFIACQESDGSITLGDSHQYTKQIETQRSEEIDQLLLTELESILQLPNLQFDQRWLGHYASLPGNDVLKLRIADSVFAITMTNGQGMTHGFAVAEDVINEICS